MGWGTCKYGGQTISWGDTSNSGYQPFEPDGSGRHQCHSGRTILRKTIPGGHRFLNDKEPRTYPTTCWWCGASVYFHTNGNGDMVLFDELGWPWQVHHCWLDRKPENEQKERIYLETVSKVKISGNSYIQNAEFFLAPVNENERNERNISITGVVIYNRLYTNQPEITRFGISDKSPRFYTVAILVNNYKYIVFLPHAEAEVIKIGSIVKVDCIWFVCRNYWRLIAKNIINIRYPNTNQSQRKILKTEWPCKCQTCGCLLEDDEVTTGDPPWVINLRFEIQCKACFDKRPMGIY